MSETLSGVFVWVGLALDQVQGAGAKGRAWRGSGEVTQRIRFSFELLITEHAWIWCSWTVGGDFGGKA